MLFYAGMVAVLVNAFRRVVYALGIPFTAGQMAIWLLVGMPTFEIGVFDKVVQGALVVVLVYPFANENGLVAENETVVGSTPAD